MAVAAAERAARLWCDVPTSGRVQHLLAIADEIRGRAEPLSALLVRECGQPRCEALDDLVALAKQFIDAAGAPAGADPAPRPGVLALLTSPGKPLEFLAMALLPALLAGRTVVCKPPLECPLSCLALAECFATLPAGVVNVVTGDAVAAEALISHADVTAVIYAGDTHTGRTYHAMATNAGKSLQQLTPEIQIGVITADADLELAVAGTCWQWLQHSGQRGAPRRLYVERAVAAAVADRIHEYAAFLEVGDPTRADTDLGPVISFDAMRAIEARIAHATKAGARLKLGGRQFQPWGLKGHFLQPTLLTDVGPSSEALCDQIDGPVICLTPFDDFAQIMQGTAAYDGKIELTLYCAPGSPMKDRLSQLGPGSHAVEVNSVTERDPRWFPYANRR